MKTNCPGCGEDQEARGWGLDVLWGDELRLHWSPCCLDARSLVGKDGWERVWGEGLVATLRRELQLPVKRVDADNVVILETGHELLGALP